MKCKCAVCTAQVKPSGSVSRSFRKVLYFLPQVSNMHLHHFCSVGRSDWCRVMFPSALGRCDVEHWQPSAKIWWGQKGHLCWKRFFFPSILLKSLSHQSWSLTPSFCFSFGRDTEGHEVCHSEADIAFCGPRFEYVCLRSHSMEMRSVQSSARLLRK